MPNSSHFRFLASDNYPHIGHVNNLKQAGLCGGLYYHTAWYGASAARPEPRHPPSRAR